MLRFGALTTVAVLTFSTAAFAQDDPASTPPAPVETSAPPSSAPVAPPPAQAEQPESISGVLYADKNTNGQRDPGEEISGGKIDILGGADESAYHSTISGDDGRFAFSGLAPGTYHPTYQLEDGWTVHHANAGGDLFTVKANETTEISVRAERPFREQLTATATFDRESYRLPASATIKLTITNTTNRKINGIKPRCDSRPNGLGSGKNWDALVANGLSLEAGAKREMSIVEEIPEEASLGGVVTLDCSFAPNPGWNGDGPSVHAEAKASGGAGTYTLVLGEDRNADSRIDEQEAARGLKVVLIDPRTGEQVVERTTAADGKVEFSGLPVGEYRVVLVGWWAFTDPAQELLTITGKGGADHRFLKFATPADVRTTMKFDKPRYESHETVTVEFTVKNNGGQTAEGVKLDNSLYSLLIPNEQWGDFGWNGRGVRIPAGESRTFSYSGKIRQFSGGKLTLNGFIKFVGRPDRYFHDFDGTADIIPTSGSVTGLVYEDANRNGRPDAGEAAPDAVVEISGGAPLTYRKTTSDAEGRFSLTDVPSGEYWISYTLAGGWIVHIETGTPQIWVQPGTPLDLTTRADRPYSELLKATVELDKQGYVLGEDARITVTLTNNADREIRGIKHGCNRVGDSNHFGGTSKDPFPAGWGDLNYYEPGVTLAAHETKKIVVTEKVPHGARLKRIALVACDFAPEPGFNTDGPFSFDWASVPGGVGSVKGRLAHDRNNNHVVDPGEAVPGARVLLMTDKENGYQLADSTSDAEGNTRFDQAPPGEFWAWVDGPWQFEGDNGKVDIRADAVTERDLFVVPVPQAAPPPAQQHSTGGTRGALAKTGASVLGLGLLAALLVAFGFGIRVAGRRRTS